MVVADVPSITLSNGVKMPIVGLGTWQSTDAVVKKAVKDALDAGYRLIDTAKLYENESAIGEALQEYFATGKLKREDVFVTTKCWSNYLHPGGAVEEALRESLERLRLDYVDLYLVHNPCPFLRDNSAQDHKTTIEDYWPEFESVYNKKLTRAIGISNFTPLQIGRVLKITKVPIHAMQIELHLYLPQLELVKIAKEHNIAVTSYGSLGSPGRTDAAAVDGVPLKWVEVPVALEDPRIKELAVKYKKTPGQVLLRFLIQRGIAVIPKSSNPERIHQNIDIFDFKLADQEIPELLVNEKDHWIFWHYL